VQLRRRNAGFHRQDKDPRARGHRLLPTLYGWIDQLQESLRPLMPALKQHPTQGSVLQIDDWDRRTHTYLHDLTLNEKTWDHTTREIGKRATLNKTTLERVVLGVMLSLQKKNGLDP
jgi:hypothetical protein